MNNFYENIDKHINDTTYTPSSKKRFSLKKNKIKTYIIYSTPNIEHIKLKKEDIEKIRKKTLGNEVLKFRKKLYKKFTSENLTLLNNNIKSLKVKIKYIAPEILLLKFASGTYNVKKNKIELINFFKEVTTNHEFFHMATSLYYKKGKLGFAGFQQINYLKEESIGHGLNEGYTEILVNRYFNEQNKFIDYSYDVCKFFVSKLEEIVEKERMEKFYMNADLFGLANYLTNFDEQKHVMTFIIKLDSLVRRASETNQKKLETYYDLLECYLAKWYICKKRKDLDNGIIDKNTFNEDVKNYIYSLENENLGLLNFIKEKEYCLK